MDECRIRLYRTDVTPIQEIQTIYLRDDKTSIVLQNGSYKLAAEVGCLEDEPKDFAITLLVYELEEPGTEDNLKSGGLRIAKINLMIQVMMVNLLKQIITIIKKKTKIKPVEVYLLFLHINMTIF